MLPARVLPPFSKPNWNLLAERFYAPACWGLRLFAPTRSTPFKGFSFSPSPDFFYFFFFIWFPSSTYYEDWYSFVCSDHALDLFYFFLPFRESVRSLESIDFKQPLQRLPQDRYSFFASIFSLFFSFRVAREKYLTYPANLFFFASQSIYGTDLTDTELASIYNVRYWYNNLDASRSSPQHRPIPHLYCGK